MNGNAVALLVVSTIRPDGTLETPNPRGQVADVRDGRVSPDGRYFAYSAMQAGELEVFVT